MKGAILLILTQIVGLTYEQTLTKTSISITSPFVKVAGYVGNNLIYLDGLKMYGSNNIEHLLLYPQDMACSTRNTGQCILAGDHTYFLYSVSASGVVAKKEEYKLKTPTGLRIISKVVIIEGSEYFLGSALSGSGVMRMKYGKFDLYAGIIFPDLPNYLETLGLIMIPKSKHAIVSYGGYTKLIVFEFLTMTEVRRLNSKAGLLGALQEDISVPSIINIIEYKATKLNYEDGTIISSLDMDYVASAIAVVPWSDWTIVGSWEAIYIYNFAGSNPALWSASLYRENLGLSISTVAFNPLEGEILIAGAPHLTKLSYPQNMYCHPACSGCTRFLSHHFCTACAAGYSFEGQACVRTVAKVPVGGTPNLMQDGIFSPENTKPVVNKPFDIRDYLNYIYIAGGGVLGIITLCCTFKACCSGGDDDEDNRRNRVRQRKRDDDDD